MTTDRVLPRVNPGGSGETVTGDGSAPVARPVIVPVPGAPSALRPSSAAPASASASGASSSAAPAAVAPAARLVKPRGDAWLGPATRAGVLVGVSAAIYAASLASVAGLESQSQARAVAGTQPGLDAIANAKAANDQLEAQLKDASDRLKALGDSYTSTSSDLAAYQAQFQQLSALVAKIQGSAAAMNANFKLPSVTIRGAVGGGGGTTVVTTTGGSGKP